VKKKVAPRSFAKRTDAREDAPRALASTAVTVGMFASGALLLALSSGCTQANATPESVPALATSAEASDEVPIRIVASDPAPSTSGTSRATPVPTTVVIRPGHPMRTAGVMVPIRDRGRPVSSGDPLL
jgi:hypothetical protein